MEISLGSHSHFQDVTVTVATGEVAVEMTSDATVVGNASVRLSVATGSINVTLATPPEVGIRFTASTTVEPMNIATTWGNVSNGVAQTSNYGTTPLSLDVTATVNAGSVDAHLN
ncbi:MAG: hypothetical protein ACTSPE_12100 [Candidatus Thorarchaeota archaeon]